MATTERVTAVEIFVDRTHAEHALAELIARGFQPEQIGFLTSGEDGKLEVPSRRPGDRAEGGAGVGAAAGGAVGGLLGAALATVMIPGVGPVIAGGMLVGAVELALAGATGGGLLGALIGVSIPEEHARHCDGEFRSGRTVVTVRADGRYDEAMAILRRAARWEERRHGPPGERLQSLAGTPSTYLGDGFPPP